ncbi:MAG: hypothetical protein QME96_09675 [Myxococcota bacterium]|nr:hypothetical protein [Myxococcota bacterium]
MNGPGCVALLLIMWTCGGAAGCSKAPRDAPFGAACSSDSECASGICLFRDRLAARGACTRRCDLDRDDCPEGTACATIAEHGGGSVPVCGDPPPGPFGSPLPRPAVIP